MIGQKIKEQRRLKGLTQKELAKLTGISFSAIEKYERGKLNPSFKNVEVIARTLNIGIDILMPLTVDNPLEGLDIMESKFEQFIEIHGQGFMYDKAPKEIQDKFRGMFHQCLYVDALVESKEVEKEFTGDAMIASVFYDYISRMKREHEADTKILKEQIEICENQISLEKEGRKFYEKLYEDTMAIIDNKKED